MNDLGIALVWLAVQVTAVALAGLGLTAWAARRTPAAGASAALTALSATAVLAVVACCPLPGWWAWDVLTPSADAAPAADPGPGHEGKASTERPNPEAASSGGGFPLAGLLSSLRNPGRGSASAAAAAGSSWGWAAVMAVVAGAGTALGLLRLLLGLWAIGHTRRRSRPVTEPDLLRLVDELRSALGVTRPVAVRESADLTTAATVGWRRPMLLLPADWRGWTAAQQRAVVAHELAHVGRGDFAAWLLARLSVALHFWHPLVRGLAGRLHLQQELAADVTAARLAGGRPAYLRALAELVLRSDNRAHGWPAPAFLSRKGTLLRRIEMLRITDDGVQRPASRTGRRLTLALVFALTLTASALRGPAREALAASSAGTPRPAAVAPFNLSLVGGTDDKDIAGVFGIRPAALLKRPSMKPLRRLLNAEIDTLTAALKPGGVGIHVEDVEQVMGRVYIRGENKTGQRSVMGSLNVLRTTRDMDWAKLRDQCGRKMKQHRWKGETYVSFSLPPFLQGITGVKDSGYLWAADARTLVFDSEKVIKALIAARAGGPKPAAPAYAAGWDRMSRGLFALALDNRGRRLVDRSMTAAEMKEALADPTKPEYHFTQFCRKVSTVVLGVAGGDDFQFDLRASADTPAAARTMARTCEAWLVATKKAVDKQTAQAEASSLADTAALDFVRKALDRTAVRRHETVVTVHADVASGFNALLSAYINELNPGKK
jgi:beta-lactamase regulating signal transducer with metallopeptidase domain